MRTSDPAGPVLVPPSDPCVLCSPAGGAGSGGRSVVPGPDGAGLHLGSAGLPGPHQPADCGGACVSSGHVTCDVITKWAGLLPLQVFSLQRTQASRFQRLVLNGIRGFSVLMIPIAATVPSVSPEPSAGSEPLTGSAGSASNVCTSCSPHSPWLCTGSAPVWSGSVRTSSSARPGSTEPSACRPAGPIPRTETCCPRSSPSTASRYHTGVLRVLQSTTETIRILSENYRVLQSTQRLSEYYLRTTEYSETIRVLSEKYRVLSKKDRVLPEYSLRTTEYYRDYQSTTEFYLQVLDLRFFVLFRCLKSVQTSKFCLKLFEFLFEVVFEVLVGCFQNQQ